MLDTDVIKTLLAALNSHERIVAKNENHPNEHVRGQWAGEKAKCEEARKQLKRLLESQAADFVF